MKKTIAVLAGDGIGEEVMREAILVLKEIASKFSHEFVFNYGLIGGAAYAQSGSHFPEATKTLCEQADAILFGAVGGPVSEQHLEKWKNCEVNALLGIRKAFQFNANYRPVRVFPELKDLSPLKSSIIGEGIDILFIRELNGDIYFGEKRQFERDGERVATDVAEYTESQIASVAHIAFKAATSRRGKVTSVDKANVLQTSKLWREVVREISESYPEVTLENMLVDNCAMQLIQHPTQFDVILASNMFGDILSDAGAVLPGSLGLLASASLNQQGFGMFEPPSGSAPEIAGKNIANPIGQILSSAMMLRFAFDLQKEADTIEQAVSKALLEGVRTKDLVQGKEEFQGTIEMGAAIRKALF